jgi:hypothetical protein
MFPNVRMIIVALLASMVAVICAMGMFAAFGVTHEPFAQLPSDKPPLQLVFDHTVPAADARALPFGVRFQINAASSGGGEAAAAVNIPVAASLPAAVPVAAIAPAPPEPAAAPAQQTVADADSAADSAIPDAVKPPASTAADAATLKPVHRRRLVRRAPSQFADQNSSQPAFQWPRPAAPASRPATGPVSRAVANKTVSNTPAAELPAPTIQ